MSSERLVVAALLFVACRPDFGLPVSVVASPRVLAVIAEPPEVRPGDRVHLSTVAGGPDGPIDSRADYAFCTSPRPLVESNVVNADCLGSDGAGTPIATQVAAADASLAADACLEFGPDTPAQLPGQPPLRPRDPDVTGGFYAPVKVTVPDATEAIALVRVRCNLTHASAQAAVAFATRYVANTNPSLSALTVELAGQPVDLLSVPASTEVTLRATWPEGTAEPFVVHDVTTDALVDHRESLRVSWFTTAGVIPVVTSGRAEDDPALETSTTWQTPSAGGGTVWAVLRDSRGGVAVRSVTFQVR
jgi:hypothetical protein